MYRSLLKSLGKLLTVLSETYEIQPDEVEIKLTDKYNQEISKIIQYNLIEV